MSCHGRLARAQPSEEQAASPAGEKVRLVYRGYEGCPDAGAFRAAVAQRVAASDWEASPGELARRIDVVVARAGDAYVATIELLDADGHRLRRAVRGRDCGDVVNGIALVTALAIESRIDEAFEQSEPTMATAENASVSAASPTSAASSEPARATSVSPAAEPAPGASGAAPAAVVAEEPPAQSLPSDAASVPLRWRAGVRGGILTGIAPSVAPGGGIAGMLEIDAMRFGLSVFGFSSGHVIVSGVEARFDLLTARVEGCPIAFDLGESLALEPCVMFEGGVLRGRGYSDPPTVAEGQSGRAPWLAPGALARLVASFGAVVVELEGGARFPLRREEFYVLSEGEVGATRTSVHEVPATSFGAVLGVGLRL